MEIVKASTRFETNAGYLSGEDISQGKKYLSELKGIFADRDAFDRMDPHTPVYEVQMHQSVVQETAGGLFFGISRLFPGKVGNEYFMTKGHFHQLRDRAEYYWGISGVGVLLFMDERRKVTAYQVEPGSLHYIPGHIAHRLVNTGNIDLVVGACWPSDSGHDYDSILQDGFLVRVYEQDGKPVLRLTENESI